MNTGTTIPPSRPDPSGTAISQGPDQSVLTGLIVIGARPVLGKQALSRLFAVELLHSSKGDSNPIPTPKIP